MSTDEAETKREGGSPAHSFGNALAWNWSREMPRYLKGGFLTMLYALRTMASASGELRFRDGKVIKIQDIAKAAGCREHDGRRYLEAGIRAGVVMVKGERRRGKATLYTIPGYAWPDWKAAEDYLKATARRHSQDEPAVEGSVRSGTNSDDEGSGRSGMNSGGSDEEAVRSTEERPGSGHSGTHGSDHGGPNIPGVTHEIPHDMAEVVTQPEVIAGEAGETDESSIGEETGQPSGEPAGPVAGEEFGRCETCSVPLVRAGITRCSVHREAAPGRGNRRRGSSGAGRAIQGPLLISVPGTSVEQGEAPQAPPAPRREAADPFAPARICGCGRGFRDRDRTGRCPDCVFAAAEETRLAGLRGVSNA